MSEAKEQKMPIFAERFRELRSVYSQAEFASFLGISRPTVGFYENGERVPDALVLRQIAEKCNVTADYLIGLSDNKSIETSGIGATTGLSDLSIERLQDMSEVKSIINAFISSEQFYEIIAYIDIYREKTTKISDAFLKYQDILEQLIVGDAKEDERRLIVKKITRLVEQRMISYYGLQELIKDFVKFYCDDLIKKENIEKRRIDEMAKQYFDSAYCPQEPVMVWGVYDEDDVDDVEE